MTMSLKDTDEVFADFATQNMYVHASDCLVDLAPRLNAAVANWDTQHLCALVAVCQVVESTAVHALDGRFLSEEIDNVKLALRKSFGW
jgi:biotin carboxylase